MTTRDILITVLTAYTIKPSVLINFKFEFFIIMFRVINMIIILSINIPAVRSRAKKTWLKNYVGLYKFQLDLNNNWNF